LPQETLYRDLVAHPQVVAGEGPAVVRIGDCEAPGLIAHAVYAGHRFAREFDMTERDRAAVPRDGVATALQ
ncbi:MAG: hypothetical protein O3A38_10365, partial [Proteobacteria bacterium]|nr:hypothetical protein [Pseudomonadota bacterium]